jgi:hypothetical protein
MALYLNKLVFLALLVSLTLNNIAYSIEVEALYSVKVGVNDQTRQSREKATLHAFKEILVRKSGSREILSSYEVEQAYRKVTSYLQRYEYEHVDEDEFNQNDLVTSDKSGLGPLIKYELLLDFEPRLIDELIQSAGMPIWGSNRPLTILWLAVEQNFEREIIKDTAKTGSFSDILGKNAIRRGIPLLLPLMDLEDQLNVNISDIWGRFSLPIANASKRYAADSVLTGRISQQGTMWHAKLTFLTDDSEQPLELSAASSDNLIEIIADNIAELLCEKYCVVEAAERHQIIMQVSNIKNFASFKLLEKYLSGLSSIRQVKVSKLADQHVRLDISLLGDLLAVKEALSLSNKLVEEIAPESDVFELPIIDSLNAKSVNGAMLVKDKAEESTLHNELTDSETINTALVQTNNDKPLESVQLYYRWIE